MKDYSLRTASDERGAVSIVSREPGDRRRETGADLFVVVVALLAFVAPLSAKPVSTTLLYETPTAYVLPAGALAISADLTFPLIQTSHNVNYPEADVNARFSPYRKLDFALTAYTVADYALDVKYQAVVGGPGRPSLALGVYDIGLSSYTSPVGHDTAHAWPDWKYNEYLPRYDRLPERFSAFVVTSIPVTKYARLHLGLGRGRFVGYDIHSRYLNIDYFFDEYHQWAFGLFGGVEVFVTPQVALVAEASGRDLNTGLKVNYRAFTGRVAWTKMEGLLFSSGDWRFGRLEVGLSYEYNNVSELTRLVPHLPTRHAPPAETVPQLVPVPLPTRPAPVPKPSPAMLRLEPVWFKWDNTDILPVSGAALRRDADVLLAHPDMKVVILGYASQEGSAAYNFRLSGRRAQAVYELLRSLGVPGEQMRIQVRGAAVGRPYPLHRVVDFEIEPEKQE
jgi:hypothetical protein